MCSIIYMPRWPQATASKATEGFKWALHEAAEHPCGRFYRINKGNRIGWDFRKPELREKERRGIVSLTEHNSVSFFLFLFSVLLAKQASVYTGGYYICHNNYSMTNGASMQSINSAPTGILSTGLPLIPRLQSQGSHASVSMTTLKTPSENGIPPWKMEALIGALEFNLLTPVH